MAFAPTKPTPKGLFRRTPPAGFTPILGLMGLGLAWRAGVSEFALPPALAEAFLGAMTLLSLFALLAYGVKLARRPAVLTEDLRILPGRAGLAALVLALYLVAVALAPMTGLARGLFWAVLVVHLVFDLVLIRMLVTGPAEQRRADPSWQLAFAGWIVGAMAAQVLGLGMIAVALFWLGLIAAVAVWVISMQQFGKAGIPAPLRPLVALHLVPAALIGAVASAFHAEGIAQVMALLSAGYLALLVVSARWLLKGGFTPLWGAFAFPLTAVALCWLDLGGAWRLPGALMLVAATVVVIPIALKVLQLWAKGSLAMKTNAAIA